MNGPRFHLLRSGHKVLAGVAVIAAITAGSTAAFASINSTSASHNPPSHASGLTTPRINDSTTTVVTPLPISAPSASATAIAPQTTTTTIAPAKFTLDQAIAYVNKQGFTAYPDEIHWQDGRSLNAISASLTKSTGAPIRVFFFSPRGYAGEDTTTYTRSGLVKSVRDDLMTVTYGLYNQNDPMCCPTAGDITIDFHLVGNSVQASRRIPANAYAPPGLAPSH